MRAALESQIATCIVAAWRILGDRSGNRQIPDEGEHECDLNGGFHVRFSFLSISSSANDVPI